MSDDQTHRELRRFLNERIPPASPGLSDRVLAFRAEPRDTPRTHWLVPALAVLLAIALVAALTLGPRLVRPGRVPAGSSGPQVFRDLSPSTTTCPPSTSLPSPQTRTGPTVFVSDSEGWLLIGSSTPTGCGQSAGRSELYHTTDGGGHWTAQLLFDGFGQQVRIGPDGSGLVVAQTGSSSTWTPTLSSAPATSVPTVAQSAVSGSTKPLLFRSSDRGVHWERVTLPAVPVTSWGPYQFRDANTGWLLAYGAVAGKPDGTVFKTTDAGRSWSTTSFDIKQAFGGTGGSSTLQGYLTVWDARNAVFIPATSTSPDNSLVTYASHDGGATWQRVELAAPPAGALTQQKGAVFVGVLPTGTAAGVAEFGRTDGATSAVVQSLIFTTTNAGSQWSLAAVAPMPGSSFAVLDANHWWVAGGGSLASTADGGRTWTLHNGVLPAGLAFSQPVFVSPERGWSLAYDSSPRNGTLFSTTDGGAHWTKRTVPPPPTIG